MSPMMVVELHTSEGPLCVQLYREQAPEQCAAFVRLAESGQFNGPLFKQMIPGFALLGDAYQCREQDTVYGLLETSSSAGASTTTALRHVGAGLLSCRHEQGSVATSRFLLTLGPQPLLDKDYTVFGRLYSGLSVLARISKMQTDTQGNLFSPVTVQRAKLVTVPTVTPPTETAEARKQSTRAEVQRGKLVLALADE